MKARSGRRRNHADRFTGIVFAWSCAACQFDGAREYAPGRYNLGPIHIEHVPELAAKGWEVTTYADGPPDVVCTHYAALPPPAVADVADDEEHNQHGDDDAEHFVRADEVLHSSSLHQPFLPAFGPVSSA
jgi:hypothetical protein